MVHTRQPRPYSGLGLGVKILTTFSAGLRQSVRRRRDIANDVPPRTSRDVRECRGAAPEPCKAKSQFASRSPKANSPCKAAILKSRTRPVRRPPIELFPPAVWRVARLTPRKPPDFFMFDPHHLLRSFLVSRFRNLLFPNTPSF